MSIDHLTPERQRIAAEAQAKIINLIVHSALKSTVTETSPKPEQSIDFNKEIPNTRERG